MKLLPKGQSNGIKIGSLAIGLAMGLILIAKVCFEQSYEDFVPHVEDVYQVNTTYTHGTDKAISESNQVSGATAPAIKRYTPAVVAATRWTWKDFKVTIQDNARHTYAVNNVAYADSSFFEVFGRPILVGDPKEVLQLKGQVMICRSLAQRIGGNVIGKAFVYADSPDKPFIVGGIYEDFPENTDHRFEMLVSLPTLADYSYDGTNNYVGNDRYQGFLRLVPGTSPDAITPAINQMMKENIPQDELAKAGTQIKYWLRPYRNIHTEDKTVKTISTLLTIIAIVLLFTAVMNYVLIVVSTLVNRAKNIAVRKCYGAGNYRIYRDVLLESALHLFIALTLAALLLLASSSIVKDLMGTSLHSLFTPTSLLILSGICLVVLLICGLLPGYLYTRIPLHYAFRRFRENRRYWKLGLLFFQFILSSMLISIVMVVFGQYHFITTKDMGYDYKNIVYFKQGALSYDSLNVALREIEKLPCVKSASYGYELFVLGSNGDNITLPGSDEEIMNVADLYLYDRTIFHTFNIPIVQGSTFTPNAQNYTEAMVDEKFVEEMKKRVGWSDNIIGKQIMVSSFDKPLTIVGVYHNVVIGNLAEPDERASVMVNINIACFNGFINLTDLTAENKQIVQHKLEELFPTLDLPVKTYESEVTNEYDYIRTIRDAIIYGCIATLFITLIGLIGYIQDEVTRRSSETAIRKINGATTLELQRLFITDIIHISLPALVIGALGAYYLSTKFMELFATKMELSWYFFVGGALLVELIILATVSIKTYKIANDNPIDNLKSE